MNGSTASSICWKPGEQQHLARMAIKISIPRLGRNNRNVDHVQPIYTIKLQLKTQGTWHGIVSMSPIEKWKDSYSSIICDIVKWTLAGPYNE